MTRRRILSGAYGLAVVALAIWLDAHGRKLQSQVFVCTAFALAAPFGVAAVTSGGFRQRGFRVALASCMVIHALFLWRMVGLLPFPTLGVAILLGIAEALVLVILSAKITAMVSVKGKIGF